MPLTAESEAPTPDGLRVTFGRVALVPADDDGEGIVELELAGEVDLRTVELPPLPSGDVQPFASDQGLPEDGVYGQLRLIVDCAQRVFADDSTTPIFVPSGAQRGLRIAIEPAGDRLRGRARPDGRVRRRVGGRRVPARQRQRHPEACGRERAQRQDGRGRRRLTSSPRRCGLWLVAGAGVPWGRLGLSPLPIVRVWV